MARVNGNARGCSSALPAFVAMLVTACGGGGGASTPTLPPPPDPATTVTVRYLRVDPSYDGWGLHLWGNAISASVATSWSTPRMPDRIENAAAVFEIPVVAPSQELNFIAHNGDLKSPIYDLSIVPQSFGLDAWIVQDEVASLNGDVGTPFATEAAALAALNALGNQSASLDLSMVSVNDSDSGLPDQWTTSASFMEIYVRGYQDSDADGVGDLNGLISRLDYLEDLGITGIWLMPVTESADNDHGYAVQDYRAIESDYGSMADFERLLAEAHARGIAVIIDYVMNHAASTNPLFLDASTGSGNDKRDWFVWESARPQGWNTFAGDPWRNNGNGWYYGVFSTLMPDFNLQNPDVVNYHKDNLRFWLNKGVDGFRFDAVGVLVENGPAQWEDQPENHSLLADIQNLVGSYNKRYLVCEAPAGPAAYANASSCGRAFAFGRQGDILESVRDRSVNAGFVAHLQGAGADRMPLFLSNHDSFAGDRVWNQLNGDGAHYKLAAASYLLAAQTPFVYYGEEIGIANGRGLSGDHALRTPMSWTIDPVTAGFSTVVPFRALAANSTTHNVELEDGDPQSLLGYYRELLAVRSDYPVIASGSLDAQVEGGGTVLVLVRSSGTECAVVAVNYDVQDQAFSAATPCADGRFSQLFGGSHSALADPSGVVALTAPARAAVIYHAPR